MPGRVQAQAIVLVTGSIPDGAVRAVPAGDEQGWPEKGTRLFSMQPRAVPIRQQPRRQGLVVVERVQVVDVQVVDVVVVVVVQGISSRTFSSLNWSSIWSLMIVLIMSSALLFTSVTSRSVQPPC